MNLPEIELLAQRQAIIAMFHQSVRTVWWTLLAVLGSVAFAWGYVSLSTLLVWSVVFFLLIVHRYTFLRRCIAAQNFLDDPASKARYHTCLVTITGVAFATGFLIFSIHSPAYILYGFISISVAIAATASIVFATHRPSFLGYSLPLLLTPMILLLYDGYQSQSTGTLILGGVSGFFPILLITIHARMHRILLENYRLQIEKDRLLEKLKVDNVELSVDRDIYRAASLTDKLTNTPNRRHFDIILKREWERAHREATQIACVMLDIDHFKDVNDRFGHDRGDEYLSLIASTLSKTLNRSSDFLARYGGEEFAAILPNTDTRGATVIAEHLRRAVASLALDTADPETCAVVTVSAGVSSMRPKSNPDGARTLVAMADAALYQGKDGGRDRVVVSGTVN